MSTKVNDNSLCNLTTNAIMDLKNVQFMQVNFIENKRNNGKIFLQIILPYSYEFDFSMPKCSAFFNVKLYDNTFKFTPNKKFRCGFTNIKIPPHNSVDKILGTAG